jgi:Spy/CpxP family protein refolding chaperone
MRTLTILILAAGTVAAQATPQPAPAPTSERFDRFVQLTAEIDKLTELSRRYTDSHPEVAALKARLAGLRAQLAAERVSSSPLDTAMRTQVEQLQARLKASIAPVQATFYGRLPDNWWRNAGVVNTLRLTPAQVRQMEEVFQQHRLKLIDLNATLEKEEVTLEPLVSADKLDEGKLTAQIDRVAQARAELEKSRGRMLVGIRRVLETEQWRKLSEMGFTVTGR